jgi:cytoskeletal protein RodZ
MSLINDALKRLQQTQKKEPGSEKDAPLQPVPAEPSPRRGSMLIIPVCLVLLGLAGWFFWQWWNGSSKTTTSASSASSSGTNRLVAGAKLIEGVKAISSNRSEIVSSAQRAADTMIKTNSPVLEANVTAGQVAAAASGAITNLPPESVMASTNSPGSEIETGALASAGPSKNVNFPALKLQGIYYRLSKPSALINNKTLYLNDEIEGVRLVGIERHSVTIEAGGRTKELRMVK